MRHARSGKKLGRDSAHRRALYSNLASALITHGRIETTEAKAKAVKPYAEKLITLGKRGDLHARRLALAELRSNDIVHHLFLNVAPRFSERDGGYTRIVKIGPRQGDAGVAGGGARSHQRRSAMATRWARATWSSMRKTSRRTTESMTNRSSRMLPLTTISRPRSSSA